ncbi:MAG: hypothetical protein HON65_05550 [Rhodospirillales bacterium]|nr:hypothetical protein [Rhodospirillales bacterium]
MRKVNTIFQSTSSFALLAFGLTVLFWGVVSLPYISNYLLQVVGFDPLTLVKSGGVLGPKKIYIFKVLAGVVSGFLVLAMIPGLFHPGRFTRLLVVVLVLPVIWSSTIWINQTAQGVYAKRIHSMRLPTVDYDLIFDKSVLDPDTINSFDDFYRAVDKNFNKYQDVLKTRWAIKDRDYLRSLFYLNTVSGLFSFGNAIDVDGPGCAVSNEETGYLPRDQENLGVRFYLDSKIGCCTDYAYLLKYLLDRSEIESRILVIPVHGHVFNEVNINGKWHALDANIGAFYQQSWNDIVGGAEPFEVILFPTMSIDGSKPSYRFQMSMFIRKILLVAASGAERGTYKDTLPSYVGDGLTTQSGQ